MDRGRGIQLGSSPSGFTTRETKVHVVCESELDKLAKPAGPSRDTFGGARQILLLVLREKEAEGQKKVLKVGIQKVIIFRF